MNRLLLIITIIILHIHDIFKNSALDKGELGKIFFKIFFLSFIRRLLFVTLLIFWIVHSTSLGTSIHLDSILLEFKMTTANLKPSFLIVAERQGPAVGVIPVFKPEYPCSRSLFVFSH